MTARCEVLPGEGTVARRGDNLLWASAHTSDAVLESLLACLDLRDPAAVGVVLTAAAAALPAQDGNFVLLINDGIHARAVCRGAELQVAGRPVGADNTLLVLDGPVQVGSTAPATPGRHDLRDGSVPGGGFYWTPSLSRAARHEPELPALGSEPTPDPPAAVAPVVETVPPPLLTAAFQPADRAEDNTQENPAANAAAATTASHRAGSSGSLMFEDGTTIELDADLVLGRRPDQHELVTSGAARPRLISDPEHVLSSAHASVRGTDGKVWVTDLDSLNGTHVAAPDARDWTRLAPGEPFPLVEGYRLLLGWTVLTFHPTRQ